MALPGSDPDFADLPGDMALHAPGQPVRGATRWTLTGSHTGNATSGRPTGAPMRILGITHAEIHGTRVMREWVMADEFAIWRRVGRKRG